MQVTTLRFGLTKNLGNYESAKMEVEIVPSEGQTVNEALDQAHSYVAAYVSSVKNTNPPKGVSVVNAEHKNPADKVSDATRREASNIVDGKADWEEKPKKRKRGRPRKSQKPAETKKPESKPAPADDGVPFEPNVSTGKPDYTTADARDSLDPQTSDGIDLYNREVRFACESETLGELLERFSELRDWGANYSTEQWEQDVTRLAQRYRELNGPGQEVETQDALVAAFKAERTFIDNRRREENRIKQRAGKAEQRTAA